MRIITIVILFISLNVVGQKKIENLKVNWPEKYDWKIVSNQENEQMHFLELVPGTESGGNWTIIGSTLSIKGMVNVPMDFAINLFFEQTKTTAPKARLKVFEKNETDKNHWTIFSIESPRFIDDKIPESQLYYIIQGESSLYSNFVAIKEKKLSEDFINEWMGIFKTSELIYQ